MRWQLWAISFALMGLNFDASALEQDSIVNSPSPIKDFQTTSIELDHFALTSIKTIQLEIKIEHSYIGDLTIFLQDPSGEKILLQKEKGGSSNQLDLVVTSDDILSSLKGKSAVGKWQLLVSDGAKYDEGQVSSVYMLIEGDEVSTPDDGGVLDPTLPTDPTPPVEISGSCGDKWEQITEARPLETRYVSLINLCGEDFKAELKRIISTNKDLGYTGARKVMFSSLDNVDGVVCSVYTRDCLETSGIPSSNVMNCEHTWPQSMGATGIAKADLHHLYPVDSKRNSTRSNYPFCDVDRRISGDDESALGYSVQGTKCFEPPVWHKGNVARSMFYFAVRYGKRLDAEQESYFRTWNQLDPVDTYELTRTGAIEEVQGNRNPFVDHPEFIALF